MLRGSLEGLVGIAIGWSEPVCIEGGVELWPVMQQPK